MNRRSGAPGLIRLILASASASRAAVLRQAGLVLEQIPAGVDEEEVKHSLRAEGADAGHVAATLADLKAQQVSRRYPDAFVIGADQMLECNGVWFDKPPDLDHARAHLVSLRGRTHELITAAVVVRGGARIWQHVDRAQLTMRPFSDDFIDGYLRAAGAEVAVVADDQHNWIELARQTASATDDCLADAASAAHSLANDRRRALDLATAGDS